MRRSMIFSMSAALAVIAFAGCESAPRDDDEVVLSEEEERIADVSTDAILDDLTPELLTLEERPVDVDVAVSRTFDMNWRMMYEDLGRVFLTDRPSRLSPMPIP